MLEGKAKKDSAAKGGVTPPTPAPAPNPEPTPAPAAAPAPAAPAPVVAKEESSNWALWVLGGLVAAITLGRVMMKED